MRTPAFWYCPPGLTARLLAPAGWAFAAGGRLRRHLAPPPPSPPCPTLCIGNLVAGGAGKTPTALWLLDALRTAGIAAHAISRGHGGDQAGPLQVDPAHHCARMVGDEPLLLAAVAPTWIARHRPLAMAAAAAAGAQALIVDDGFQNPHLPHTASLLVVDGVSGFGNGRVIPAGPLREPVAQGIARADALLLLGEDRHALEPWLRDRLPATAPLWRGRLEPTAPLQARHVPGRGSLTDRPAVAFAGLARPEKFFATCTQAGFSLAATLAFADHHPYTRADETRLSAIARAAGDAVLLTTAKDAVRLSPAFRADVSVLPVRLAIPDAVALLGWLRQRMGIG